MSCPIASVPTRNDAEAELRILPYSNGRPALRGAATFTASASAIDVVGASVAAWIDADEKDRPEIGGGHEGRRGGRHDDTAGQQEPQRADSVREPADQRPGNEMPIRAAASTCAICCAPSPWSRTVWARRARPRRRPRTARRKAGRRRSAD
jgi:hypothetical protein